MASNKILITNWRLGTKGGTERWCELMAKTLEGMGHKVDVSDKPTEKHYDLALINHLDPKQINADRKIYTSHGVIPELETPKEGADVYVGVSEEVQGCHKTDTIIRNPIDTEQFKPTREVNNQPLNILVITNNPLDMDVIEAAVKDLNLVRIGGDNRVDNVEEYINAADTVISLGRGCYEAMACNRNVVVYDYNGADGGISTESYYRFRTYNCSGRYGEAQWTPAQLRWQIEANYDPDPQFRQIIQQEHDPIKIAEEYLAL